jgi:hypothetical protein
MWNSGDGLVELFYPPDRHKKGFPIAKKIDLEQETGMAGTPNPLPHKDLRLITPPPYREGMLNP